MVALRRGIAIVMLAATSLATAQPADDPRARALSLFEESDAHYKRGEFEEAAALLREAYALHPEPILLYNLARALEGLGDYDGAIEQYQAYLDASPEVADRGGIERRIATLRAQVVSQHTGDRAVDRTDDRASSRSDSQGATSTTRSTTTPSGVSAVTLVPDDHPRRTTPKLAWVIAGAGVALVGAGAASGYLSQVRHDAAATEPIQAEAARLQDQAQRYATAANVMFVVGGAAVLGGVTWALLARRGGAAPAPTVAGARVELGAHGVTATWELR